MKKDYQGYLIDLDGTIYLGKEPIPAGKRFVEQLQEKDLPFLFVTNNTTKSPETAAQRLANRGKKVFVIGEAGLIDLILEAGFEWDETNPDYVVVGLDTELSYEKVVLATLAIQKGALFIGTNPDKNIPTERGLLPGAGSVVTFVETATQTKPVYIGKPKAIIMERAIAHLGVEKEQVIMVGDNYETDIQSGIQNGIDSLLVTSGFTPKSAVPTLPTPPTYVVDSLDEWTF